ITYKPNEQSEIKQANLTFTANEASKTYDGTKDVIGDNTYTHTALVNDEYISVDPTVAYDNANVNDKSKGEYRTVDFTKYATILNKQGEDTTQNYNITYKPNNYSEIKQAELTLTAKQVAKRYDGTTTVEGKKPYYTATGLVNGEKIDGVEVEYDKPEVGIGNKIVKITNTGVITTADGKTVTTDNYIITPVENKTSTITDVNSPDPNIDPQEDTNKAIDNYNNITGDIHTTDTSGTDGDDPDGNNQLKDGAGNTAIDTTNDKQAIKVDEEALAKALHEDGNDGVDISSQKSGEVETETINVGDFSDGDESGKAAK
ncbi:hypothetical protein, partial [Selenomonas ruminantium]